MRCSRCRGWLIGERIETAEGRLSLVHCLNCGFVEDRMMRRHKLAHPQPLRNASLPVYIPQTRLRQGTAIAKQRTVSAPETKSQLPE